MSATCRGAPGARDARAAGPARPSRAGSPFTEAIGPAGDVFEQEADCVAAAIVRGGPTLAAAGWAAASTAAGTIQRAPKGAAAAPAADAPTAPMAAPEAPAGPAKAAPKRLVDDD